MKRGEIYDARLEPVEGSEQGGTRPVVLAVPCTTYQTGRRIYPTQVLITALDGGLTNDSIVMADQVRVLSKSRLLRLRGTLSKEAMTLLDKALLIALDLPGQI
jgi:mRNA interferase MazF